MYSSSIAEMRSIVGLSNSTTVAMLLALSLLCICLVYIAQLIKGFSRKNPGYLPRISELARKKANTSDSGKPGYEAVFPPPQRQTLVGLDPRFAGIRAVDLSTLPKSGIVKLQDDYRNAKPTQYIFSGFMVQDIRQLGSFPNYATLSGVPLPSPLKSFDIDKALPRPYRPFRWPYHQTMSLTKMDPDFWIELESTYRERIVQREKLFAEHGTEVLAALPGSELACTELMEMVLQFICARYPNQFHVKNGVLVNRILQTQTNLVTTPPLEVLLHNVPEDFGIVLRDEETGCYVLRAGMICSSVGWKLSEKVGLGLPGIHKSVPDYKEKMEFSMDRFFTKMPTNKPIQRGSWGLEIGQPLFLPAEHPEYAHRESQNPSLRPEDINLRVDWQTLRRLPLSGGVVFNFKALFTPLTEFKDEPYIPSLLLAILRGGKENLMKYKGTWHVEHVAKPTLEKYEQFQINSGMIGDKWEPQSLPEQPFFRGWEKKWA